MQSAILWEVMKSYKILENAVISTQSVNYTFRKETTKKITNLRNLGFLGFFFMTGKVLKCGEMVKEYNNLADKYNKLIEDKEALERKNRDKAYEVIKQQERNR